MSEKRNQNFLKYLVLPLVFLALRRVSASFFGVFMSINPVLAAVSGVLLLGQEPALHEWIGIVIVVAANGVVTVAAATRGTRGGKLGRAGG